MAGCSYVIRDLQGIGGGKYEERELFQTESFAAECARSWRAAICFDRKCSDARDGNCDGLFGWSDGQLVRLADEWLHGRFSAGGRS